MKKNNVTAATVCDFLGISTQTFATMINGGIFERQTAATGYDLKATIRAIYAHSQRRAAGRGEAGESAVLSSARARLAVAKAKEAEFKNEVARGLYVRTRYVTEAGVAMVMASRDIAMQMPGKISDAVSTHTEEDRAAVFKIIQGEIFEMLDRLSIADFTSHMKAAAIDADAAAKAVGVTEQGEQADQVISND
jgi:phage terminase Nu1 subunit (DNA packaging protein)